MAVNPRRRRLETGCLDIRVRNFGIFSAHIKYGIPSKMKARPRAVRKKVRLNSIWLI